VLDVSFIIPCSNRASLPRTLSENREAFSSGAHEIVIVTDSPGFRDVSERLRERARGLTEETQVTVVAVEPTDVSFYSKSRSLNVGAFVCRSEVMFLLDADVVIKPELIAEMVGALRPGTFVTVKRGEETVPRVHPQVLPAWYPFEEEVSETRVVTADGKVATREFWKGRHGRSMPGLMLIRKPDFVAVEGCNSELEGWGFEDYDLQIRLQLHLGLERLSLGSALHFTHPISSARQAASQKRNRSICFERYSRNNYLGTYTDDYTSWLKTANRPEPDRVTRISSVND
jgi:predicted glycosyltransferase involved in capsule biosynthesis